MSEALERLIDQGVGREPADIVLKGGRFFDLVTGELVASDIAISGERIVGTCGDYQGREEIDVTGPHRRSASSTRIPHRIVVVTPHEIRPLRAGSASPLLSGDPHEIAMCSAPKAYIFPGFGDRDDHGHPRPALLLACRRPPGNVRCQTCRSSASRPSAPPRR
ncbi:hypothetical protein F2981_00865 [Sinorhizobium meliloti]|nr:hypothetical protein [Sinorhizobium meliloti]